MAERRIGPLLVLAMVLLGVGAWLVLNSSVLAVRDIRVQGSEALSSRDVVELAGVEVGDNLFRLSPGAVEASLRRSPWVATADVERRWPSTVVLRIVERRPVGWAGDGDGTFAVVAADGTVLETSVQRPAGLPSLGTVEVPLVPAARWRGPPVAVQVAASLPPSLRREVKGVRVGERGITLGLRPGGKAIYGEPSALGAKNAALLSILHRDGLEIQYVDLRIASAPAVKPAAPSG